MQKIIKWFKNYWYYYKWQVLASAFVLFIVIFCVVQCSTQEKYDIHFTYAGQDIISNQIDDVRSAIRATFTTKEEKESNGISIRDIVWVNDALALEYQQNGIYYDPKTNSDNAKLLYNEAASGNSFVYIIDKQQYEKLKADGIFAPLSDVFGEDVPECATDEYGIDFLKTDFAKYFEVFKEWKGELVLCLRSGTLSESLINRIKGSKQYEKSYELHKQVFKDIVSFKAG